MPAGDEPRELHGIQRRTGQRRQRRVRSRRLKKFFHCFTGRRPRTDGLTIEPGAKYRLAGTSADVALTRSYLDSDTYVFHTGPTTTQVTIRLDWTDSDSDMDFAVSREGSLEVIGGAFSTEVGEFDTLAVTPNTTYWLWNAAYDFSATPLPYDISLCGETFALDH